ncbi:hypothetical protein LTR78_009828 [Recurvomyces mirabilis]|uniref:ATP-dependent RNA helicase n=1 Tax=Recurvomyces mirabilis TaxID=574656 RepID=A0AAE0TN79_9PEZI|nr:hypothetical protein LTR78_009828 [Recurvomyces mirabilis]KAK5153064.1 hypothetical protein LTS14_007708 [Recurvomyces mirabilis]
MRRVIQRCSASILRVSTTSSNVSCSLVLRRNALQHISQPSRIASRSLHQTSLLRQQVAAAAEDGDSDAPPQITRFDELGTEGIIHPTIVRTLTRNMGMETMTEVQSATINEALGGADIIAQARTGTGKTLAFLLPVLQNIISVDPQLAERGFSRRGPRTTADDIRALIISPTRELAEQIAEEAKKLVSGTGIVVQTAVGGTQKRAGLQAIQRQGCHILVGTPGRLKDILSDEYSRVEAPDLSALVFDEADRLLDQGFWPEIQEIMRMLPTAAEKDRQTLMFSATVPKEVVTLVRSTLRPGFHFVKTVRDDEEPTHTRVPQRIVTVNGFENKLPALVELVNKGIAASQQPDGKPFKAIVYYNSTAEVALAASALQNMKPAGTLEEDQDAFGSRRSRHPWAMPITDIHSKLSQGQRQKASDNFRRAETGILLSSDVTARGMDFPNVTHVIQMAIPPSREQYIHRIGRTARAGKEGEGWLIVSSDEATEVRHRLHNLPLQPDKTLTSAPIDLTRPGQIPASASQALEMIRHGMRAVPAVEKIKAYQALLGVYAWLGNKRVLVKSMNNLAQYGWGMQEPPMIHAGLAQKLRIDRIEGVRIGHERALDEEDSRGSSSGGRGGGGRSFGGREGGFGGGGGGGFGERNGGRGERFGGGGGREDRFGGGGREDRFGGGGGREDRFGGSSSGGRGGFGSGGRSGGRYSGGGGSEGGG